MLKEQAREMRGRESKPGSEAGRRERLVKMRAQEQNGLLPLPGVSIALEQLAALFRR
jgi:hypothetical protein